MILAALLLWGSTGDHEILLSSTTFMSGSLLGYAYCGSLVAFEAAVYAMISDECMWLAIVVCLMIFSVPFIM
ncbi:hypothetical protein QJS04_geneDACA018286 [Acorus gramineus]|uniref:NADH dehydrogenase subunit 4 n=1 Tax=Acorus gramineus TaxID=55184 RepID=A0AAV9B8F3_ACOGR|nr:hypothetical protein QJS04_geneDACA018286 [Acorus gramineus]